MTLVRGSISPALSLPLRFIFFLKKSPPRESITCNGHDLLHGLCCALLCLMLLLLKPSSWLCWLVVSTHAFSLKATSVQNTHNNYYNRDCTTHMTHTLFLFMNEFSWLVNLDFGVYTRKHYSHRETRQYNFDCFARKTKKLHLQCNPLLRRWMKIPFGSSSCMSCESRDYETINENSCCIRCKNCQTTRGSWEDMHDCQNNCKIKGNKWMKTLTRKTLLQ